MVAVVFMKANSCVCSVYNCFAADRFSQAASKVSNTAQDHSSKENEPVNSRTDCDSKQDDLFHITVCSGYWTNRATN